MTSKGVSAPGWDISRFLAALDNVSAYTFFALTISGALALASPTPFAGVDLAPVRQAWGSWILVGTLLFGCLWGAKLAQFAQSSVFEFASAQCRPPPVPPPSGPRRLPVALGLPADSWGQSGATCGPDNGAGPPIQGGQAPLPRMSGEILPRLGRSASSLAAFRAERTGGGPCLGGPSSAIVPAYERYRPIADTAPRLDLLRVGSHEDEAKHHTDHPGNNHGLPSSRG
jgi:hypothetical protein